MNKFQPKIADFGCEIVDAISNGLRNGLSSLVIPTNRARKCRVVPTLVLSISTESERTAKFSLQDKLIQDKSVQVKLSRVTPRKVESIQVKLSRVTPREVESSQVKSSQDKTRQDKTRQDKTRQDKTSQDKTRQDKTRQDKTRQDKTRQDKTRQETVISRLISSWFPIRCRGERDYGY